MQRGRLAGQVIQPSSSCVDQKPHHLVDQHKVRPRIVTGGQTMNPSTAQLLEAVDVGERMTGEPQPERGPIFWHYPHYGNQGGSPGSAIRMGDYKLIEFFEDDHVELFNLKNDIGEMNNLATDMPERVVDLQKKLHLWQQEVDAQMPTENPNYSQ